MYLTAINSWHTSSEHSLELRVLDKPRLMHEIGIGIVGVGFMARVHALSFAMAARMWELPVAPHVLAYCGRSGTPASSLPRWPELADAKPLPGLDALLDHPDVQLCCVCTSNASHAAVSIAALRAGMHVLCEKPLASNQDDALRMLRQADLTTAQAAVGFNYRRVPAVELARRMIAAGDIGVPRHIRARYLQDWALNRGAPRTWRDDPNEAGPGVLADIGSHLVDLAQHLMASRIAAVAALAQPEPPDRSQNQVGKAGPLDRASLLVQFADRTSGALELSRVASGNRNGLRFEVVGSEGSLAFSLERMNELQVSLTRSHGETWRRIYVTERDHPWQATRWPPGHPLSWEHTFAHQALDLVAAIAAGSDFSPNFRDGYTVDAVIAAALRAIHTKTWQPVAE